VRLKDDKATHNSNASTSIIGHYSFQNNFQQIDFQVIWGTLMVGLFDLKQCTYMIVFPTEKQQVTAFVQNNENN